MCGAAYDSYCNASLRTTKPFKLSLMTIARTGQRCPQSGYWKPKGYPIPGMLFEAGDFMIPYKNKVVTWVLE